MYKCRTSSISVHECVIIRISTVYSLHMLFFVNVLFNYLYISFFVYFLWVGQFHLNCSNQ